MGGPSAEQALWVLGVDQYWVQRRLEQLGGWEETEAASLSPLWRHEGEFGLEDLGLD